MKKIIFAAALAFLSLNSFAQDLIVKKDGSIIKAKVEEIGTSEINYKKWSNLEGPTYAISKNDILSITYQNGEQEKFQTAATVPSSTPASATTAATSASANRSDGNLMKQGAPTDKPIVANPFQQTYGFGEWTNRFGFVTQLTTFSFLFGEGLDGFNFGEDIALGGRFYATEGLYLEGMIGYRYMMYGGGKLECTEHAVTIPLHVGYQFVDGAWDLSVGPRIDCPVGYKAEYKGKKISSGTPDSHTALEIAAQYKGGMGLRYGFGVSDGNDMQYLSIIFTIQ